MSKMGMQSVTKNLNPFLKVIDENEETKIQDNEDMCKNLRAWTLEILNTSSLNDIAKKANDSLEPHLSEDPAFLTNHNLSCPVKPSSARRQMDDLEFKHCPVKKSYMISIHEREDVVKERIKCFMKNKKDEINEPFFMH